MAWKCYLIDSIEKEWRKKSEYKNQLEVNIKLNFSMSSSQSASDSMELNASLFHNLFLEFRWMKTFFFFYYNKVIIKLWLYYCLGWFAILKELPYSAVWDDLMLLSIWLVYWTLRARAMKFFFLHNNQMNCSFDFISREKICIKFKICSSLWWLQFWEEITHFVVIVVTLRLGLN
jgi:hypothetical protein